MATDKPSESSTGAGGEDEVSISMVDVLEEEKLLEEDANAVLGAGDLHNCTYPQGSVGRQPLYACRSCVDTATTSAGVCLACSLECHEGHDLVELYTKRNFRCDCGNIKFGENKCKIYPAKSRLSVNDDNQYNHNFKGLYCTCSRPYPDPDEEVEDEMIQCIICEDWHHGRHLGSKVPENEDYEEMICGACMETCNFLWSYIAPSQETKVIEKAETAENIDVTSTSPKPAATSTESAVKSETSEGEDKAIISTPAEPVQEEGKPLDLSVNDATNKEKMAVEAPSASSVSENAPQSPQGDSLSNEQKKNDSEELCMLKMLPTTAATPGATFWPDKWRCKLCKCTSCITLYKDKKVEFLLDETDTVCEYEARGKAAIGSAGPSSSHDKGMAALSQMDRTAQVEVLHQFNDFKTELRDYLAKFAENGKTVREEDIKEFFEGLKARKRQKTAAPSVQYFCK